MNIKVAILLTCYNRKKTTCACIGHVLASANKAVYNYDVFLLDDGSCDGTTAAVLSAYPQVNVTQGTGQLYWCG
jgi:glycosyltransferase involved in cell wall biosynthesis